jgi:Ca2+:H+ antiporter
MAGSKGASAGTSKGRKKKLLTGQTVMHGMLVFLPVALYLGFTHGNPTAIFITSCLALLPLAGLMGEATENITHHTGPGIGGLLNATFGNAAELIIAFVALRAGEQEIVKASITGSIVGNVLVVLGFSMLMGGWKHKELRFSRLAAESGSSTMLLAVAALVIPAVYAHVTHHREPGHIESISFDIAWVLLATYVASLIFQLKSHADGFRPEGQPDAAVELESGHVWSVKKGVLVLVVAALAVSVVSEQLVHAVDAAGAALGLSKFFMGVIVVALVGNAAEHSTAIQVAMRGKMDLAFNIAMGSSTQIALFVAPVLVIAGHWMGQPLGLEFTALEIVAIVLSVGVAAYLVQDGKTNWFEGFQLLAIYAILGAAFYYI